MKAPDFLALLRRLEEQKQLYSVKRISIVCGLIMRFAVATGRADIDPMPSLRGSLRAHKTTRLASTTDPKQVGRLLRMIHAYTKATRKDLDFTPSPFLLVSIHCERASRSVFPQGYSVGNQREPHATGSYLARVS